MDKSLEQELLSSELGQFLSEKNIAPLAYSSENLHSLKFSENEMKLWVVRDASSINANDNDWIFEVSDSENFSSNRIFNFSNLKGDAPKKLFRLLSREYLLFHANAVKEASFNNCEKIFSKTTEVLSSVIGSISSYPLDESISHYINYFIDFMAEYDKFFASKNEDEFTQYLNEFTKKHDVVFDVQWSSGDDLLSLLYLDQAGYIVVPIFGDERGDYLAFKVNGETTSDEDTFYLFCLIDIFHRFIVSLSEYRAIYSNNSLWEEVFGLIPLPVSLISPEGELLLHNKEFLKLGILPGQCLSFNDGQEFEKEQNVYKVHRVDLDREDSPFHLFSFSSAEVVLKKREKAISSEQLGIISSSIAHELNNPIGGILAALSLVELEDWWDDDSLHTITEMRKSAERCKKLVQVFLGFSRTAGHNLAFGSNDFESAFEQALSLVRFRMIESDVMLEVERVETGLKYNKEVNPAVVSMVFYLILSEVMTSISHRKLVAGECSSSISGKLYQYDDRVELEFDKNLDFADRINNSKLIGQLVDMEGQGLYVSTNKLIFQ
ncbi:MAG: hypothetical protein KAG61_05265 [Bacteriovoracaceae bacterium]|nr:hypothetical protein [Bacteriovoracaceae bacterium]